MTLGYLVIHPENIVIHLECSPENSTKFNDKNLISNPNCESGLYYWTTTNNGLPNDGWIIESPPVGVNDYIQLENKKDSHWYEKYFELIEEKKEELLIIIDASNELILKLFHTAHKQNITLNQLVNKLFKEALSE